MWKFTSFFFHQAKYKGTYFRFGLYTLGVLLDISKFEYIEIHFCLFFCKKRSYRSLSFDFLDHNHITFFPISRVYLIVKKVSLEPWLFTFGWSWCKEIRFWSSRHLWLYLARYMGRRYLCRYLSRLRTRRHLWCCLNMYSWGCRL
jgi:hypothetical protein